VPTLRGKVSRQQFPSGQDGQVLVLDTSSPHGIAWRSGIDRLITDITPELSGDLDCNGYELTSVGNIGFTAVTSTLAGIQNQNLVDKSAGAFTADVAMGTNKITGLGTPTATADAATKTYVDTAALGITALANDATPTVAGGGVFSTGGTTTITDFDDGAVGQIITVLSEHAITITDGTNIILHGSVNFVMAASDSLTLVLKADTKWYETSRMVNL
jgi:hypothetical protein